MCFPRSPADKRDLHHITIWSQAGYSRLHARKLLRKRRANCTFRDLLRFALAENAAVFDFALDAAEMEAIAALDDDRRIGPDPFDISF